MARRILLMGLICLLAGCAKPNPSAPASSAQAAAYREGRFLQVETSHCLKHPSPTASGSLRCLWFSVKEFSWTVAHCFNGCPALVRTQPVPKIHASAPSKAALERQAAHRLQAECARSAGRGPSPEQAAEVMQNFNEQGLHVQMQVAKTHYSLLKHQCYGLFAAVGTGIYNDYALGGTVETEGYTILYDYSVFRPGRFNAHEIAEVDVMTNDRHLHTLRQLSTQETTKCLVKEHGHLHHCRNILEWWNLVRPYLEQ